MFTGIVEAVGTVRSLVPGRLCLDAPGAWPGDPWAVGESVAVSGCCLTVVSFEDGLEFDLSAETLSRTTLGGLSAGSSVNLERAMKADGRFGGHIVQGHVDCVGSVIATPSSGEWRFSVEASFDRYLIEKGSVTVDGVSLTVVSPGSGEFSAALIPHTLRSTSLGSLSVGSKVNVEFDVIAKYVEKLTATPR